MLHKDNQQHVHMLQPLLALHAANSNQQLLACLHCSATNQSTSQSVPSTCGGEVSSCAHSEKLFITMVYTQLYTLQLFMCISILSTHFVATHLMLSVTPETFNSTSIPSISSYPPPLPHPHPPLPHPPPPPFSQSQSCLKKRRSRASPSLLQIVPFNYCIVTSIFCASFIDLCSNPHKVFLVFLFLCHL